MTRRRLKVAGLFAGIGGLDVGFEDLGHETLMMSEWDPAAQAVLQARFPHVRLEGDVRDLRALPRVDLVTGGFPCQDISQAGTREGLLGSRSGLVWEFFRLVEKAKPEFFLLENVANLLSIKSGTVMRQLLLAVEELGFKWAYRLVDTRGFGLPQRRQRVLILASRSDVKPELVLHRMSVSPVVRDEPIDPLCAAAYGFYWTEGKRGVGWTTDAVPTIKGGSGLGIPSPPAVYVNGKDFVGTPTIQDAERLQGFAAGWTDVELEGRPLRPGLRWRLVGNAVSVPISKWLGEELAEPSINDRDLSSEAVPIRMDRPLPRSAFGSAGAWWEVSTSLHVAEERHTPILEFLNDPLKPLSQRALDGYLNRARQTTRRIPASFLQSLARQQEQLRSA